MPDESRAGAKLKAGVALASLLMAVGVATRFARARAFKHTAYIYINHASGDVSCFCRLVLAFLRIVSSLLDERATCCPSACAHDLKRASIASCADLLPESFKESR